MLCIKAIALGYPELGWDGTVRLMKSVLSCLVWMDLGVDILCCFLIGNKQLAT